MEAGKGALILKGKPTVEAGRGALILKGVLLPLSIRLQCGYIGQ